MAGGFGVHNTHVRDYPGKLTMYVKFTCIVAAMGGLIFGYDIGISGNSSSQSFEFLSLSFKVELLC